MAAREGNIAWVAAMMRVMVQVLEQMRCSRAVEQDNFTYYSVSRVEVPVPQLARDNCRWCEMLDSRENIYEPVNFGPASPQSSPPVLAEVQPVEVVGGDAEEEEEERVWTAGEVREVEGGGRREEYTREWRGRSAERSWRGRSSTREREVRPPDEGYDSTGERRGRRKSRKRREFKGRSSVRSGEVWVEGEEWQGRVASPERKKGEEGWGGRVASPDREVLVSVLESRTWRGRSPGMGGGGSYWG